jgi:hypothetical protein
MTSSYQYTIGHQRITDLHREAERERLAATSRARAIHTRQQGLLRQITRRMAPTRVTTA